MPERPGITSHKYNESSEGTKPWAFEMRLLFWRWHMVSTLLDKNWILRSFLIMLIFALGEELTQETKPGAGARKVTD